jgi:hypothetical protein
MRGAGPSPGPGFGAIRKINIEDFALNTDGALIISGYAYLSLGQTERVIVYYNEGQQPRVIRLGDVVCPYLETAGSNVWCLGTNLRLAERGANYPLLHVLLNDGTATPLLARDTLPKSLDGPPWQPGALGSPQLSGLPEGDVFVWLPMVGGVFHQAPNPTPADFYPLPVAAAGRSVISIAAWDSRRVMALLPLRARDEIEQLTTPYGFFVLNTETKKWTRVEELGEVTRGTRLLALEPERVMLWDRRAGKAYPKRFAGLDPEPPEPSRPAHP